MARSVDARRLAVWRERFQRFQRAGLTVARFCAREQVSVPSFYLWRKKLAQGRAAGQAIHRDAATKQETPERWGDFAPVRLVGAAASLAACLPGGTRLEIPLADPRAGELLERLLRADAERAAVMAARSERAGGAVC
jgi:hypothetical protein